MSFSPPAVGCLLKKGLQEGGSQVSQDPPSYVPGVSGIMACSDLTLLILVEFSGQVYE